MIHYIEGFVEVQKNHVNSPSDIKPSQNIMLSGKMIDDWSPDWNRSRMCIIEKGPDGFQLSVADDTKMRDKDPDLDLILKGLDKIVTCAEQNALLMNAIKGENLHILDQFISLPFFFRTRSVLLFLSHSLIAQRA